MECYRQSHLSFVSDELEEVVKNTKTDMAPGSSLSSSLKTTGHWLIIQNLNGFSLDIVDVARLKFGILLLIPKLAGAEFIKKYRPILLSI
jgi:hypothetical protein